MTESLAEPIRFPGERVFPKPTSPSPETDRLIEEMEAELALTEPSSAEYEDIILGSALPQPDAIVWLGKQTRSGARRRRAAHNTAIMWNRSLMIDS